MANDRYNRESLLAISDKLRTNKILSVEDEEILLIIQEHYNIFSGSDNIFRQIKKKEKIRKNPNLDKFIDTLDQFAHSCKVYQPEFEEVLAPEIDPSLTADALHNRIFGPFKSELTAAEKFEKYVGRCKRQMARPYNCSIQNELATRNKYTLLMHFLICACDLLKSNDLEEFEINSIVSDLTEVISLLIEHKANVKIPTQDGTTPLQIAVSFGLSVSPNSCKSIVKNLLLAGAEVGARIEVEEKDSMFFTSKWYDEKRALEMISQDPEALKASSKKKSRGAKKRK